MTTSQNYSINPYFGAYDYTSIMNNPYFQYAAQSPNVNFKASQSSAQTTATSAVQNVQTKASSDSGAIPVTSPSEKSSGGSNFGLYALGGTLLAGGACLLLKGKNSGGISKAVKSIFNGSRSESVSVGGKLSRLTAVKVGKNDIRFMIPDKTVTLKGEANARTFAASNGIPEAISLERQTFDAEKSAITSFVCSTKRNDYVVKLENGTIVYVT